MPLHKLAANAATNCKQNATNARKLTYAVAIAVVKHERSTGLTLPLQLVCKYAQHQQDKDKIVATTRL